MGFSRLLPADPRAWAASILVVLAALVFGAIGQGLLSKLTPTPPPHTFNQATLWAGWTPTGAWTVHWDIEINEVCSKRVYNQRFRDETTNNDFAANPIRAYPQNAKHPIYDGTRPPGEYSDWRDFKPIPGRKGVFWLSVASAGCPSGYNGLDTLFVVPFDWTSPPTWREGESDHEAGRP